MPKDQFPGLHEDVRYIRERVDEIARDASATRERLAVVEVRAGFWGTVGGVLAALGLHFGKQP